MELTPDRKRQIEEEERQRLAEEQYRTQVRASLDTPAPQTAPAAPQRRKSHVGLLLVILAVVAVGALVVNFITRSTDSGSAAARARASSAPSVRYVPISQKIATGQVVVKANGYVQYPVQITADMRDAHLTGRFNASGGTGNDITAVVANEGEYTNWINGHQAQVYYSTQGKKTADTFDLRLGPGTYYFALSNKFSAFSDKYVFLEVDLNYSKVQTY